MKNITSCAAIIATAGLLTLPSTASAIVVGGVDLGVAGFNFQFTDVYEEKKGVGGPITAIGDTLAGYGEVSSIRDNGGAVVWQRGGIGGVDEITLQFEFIASSVSATEVDFSTGFVNFYTDTTPDFDPTATNGGNSGSGLADGDGAGAAAWLNLVLTPQDFGGTHVTDVGVHSTGTLLGVGVLSGSGVGLFDVGPGAGVANSIFNTNTFAYTSAGGGGNADLDFNSSFTNFGASQFELDFNGTANFRGFTAAVTVPEPGTLALISLGLLGAGFTGRRKKV